jgi:hypothetical protein
MGVHHFDRWHLRNCEIVDEPTGPDGVRRVTVSGSDTNGKPFRVRRVGLEDLHRWAGGTHIQDAFPYLGRAVREFFLTGESPQSWNDLFEDGDQRHCPLCLGDGQTAEPTRAGDFICPHCDGTGLVPAELDTPG